jgi:TonB family protein
MRIRIFCLVVVLVLSSSLLALPQSELGKWWKNSEIVKRLQLTETQIGQIEQSFLSHQRKLADANEQLKQQEAQLKMLMESDRVDDAKVQAQVDSVAAARATLEKMNASMMLSIRKALSKEQWKRLEDIQSSPAPKTIAGVTGAPNAGTKGRQIPEGTYVPGGPVKSPQLIHQSLPAYTQAARDARIEGIVLLEAIVQKDGSVSWIKISKGLGYGLDESAINAITKEWKFKPGTLNNQPVNVKISIETSFRLY